MQKGLSGKKDYIFTFLDNLVVPYDNNASERAVRPATTKHKVAVLFRTFLGAEAYAVVIITTIADRTPTMGYAHIKSPNRKHIYVVFPTGRIGTSGTASIARIASRHRTRSAPEQKISPPAAA